MGRLGKRRSRDEPSKPRAVHEGCRVSEEKKVEHEGKEPQPRSYRTTWFMSESCTF